jgi:hypothetical protein
MSESSEPTSSQLDDIELAEPAAKTYEHHTDVPYLFGEDNQQWSLRVLPARDTSHDRSIPAGSCLEYPSHEGLEGCDAVGAPAATPRRCDARLAHTSGAVTNGMHHEHPPHLSRRLSEARSEASEGGVIHFGQASSGTVTVDVLCPAFVLNEQTWPQGRMIGRTPAEIISQRVCTGLGVHKSSLCYFEMKEVPPSQLRPSGRYAVAIERGGASPYILNDGFASRTAKHVNTLF